MRDRETLIARKQTVRRQIEQLRRTLEHEQNKQPPVARRVRRLETQLEQLRQAQQADMLTEVQFGTLLWALVAVATEAGINAEDALRSYCVRFRNNS